VFYDDCLVANTTVIKAADVAFKTTGKEILKRLAHRFENPNAKEKKQIYCQALLKAKRSPPSFRKKKQSQQINLRRPLRAMETAGKQVDDEDLRELMKKTVLDVHPREPILY
jgi:DNA topoisomerase-3